ncbi:MAG: hypothetical protein JWR15_1407 [Prosthecobacter sp.]|nr:hypothetical protein [Prosthecobacter sp.]
MPPPPAATHLPCSTRHLLDSLHLPTRAGSRPSQAARQSSLSRRSRSPIAHPRRHPPAIPLTPPLCILGCGRALPMSRKPQRHHRPMPGPLPPRHRSAQVTSLPPEFQPRLTLQLRPLLLASLPPQPPTSSPSPSLPPLLRKNLPHNPPRLPPRSPLHRRSRHHPPSAPHRKARTKTPEWRLP